MDLWIPTQPWGDIATFTRMPTERQLRRWDNDRVEWPYQREALVNLIQVTGTTSRAGATGLAYGSNVTAGSVLCVIFAMPTSGAPNPTGGGTWGTVYTAPTSGQNGQFYSSYPLIAATGGATTVKWTGTATEVIIGEAAAVTSGAKDGVNQAGSSASANINSGNITTTGAGGLVLANVQVVLADPAGLGTGWSKELSVSNNEVVGLYSRTAGQAAGTYAFTTTLPSANWDAQIFAISAPSAGTAPFVGATSTLMGSGYSQSVGGGRR